MPQGYVRLHRRCLDGDWLKNGDLWRFWCYCLLKASHKKWKAIVGYQEIELEPGQFLFGRKAASAEMEMSERKIRTCLSTLTNFKNLTIKSTNKYSIITICNWETYQRQENETDQQYDHPPTSHRPANDQQVTTYKNVKNVKNVKNKDQDKDVSSEPEKTPATKPTISPLIFI